MSRQLYAFLVCMFTAYGVGLSGFASRYSQAWDLSWPFLLAVLVVAIAGSWIALASDNPIISLLGYHAVAIPFGLMLGPVIAHYTPASVFKVFFLTTAMVGILGVVGAVIPDSLEGWGSWLLGGLWILIGGQLLIPIAGLFGMSIDGAMTVWDWVGIVLFGGLVVFDLNRAMHIPKTLDNAIDSAIAVYLDWVSIFIRLLAVSGTSNSSSD